MRRAASRAVARRALARPIVWAPIALLLLTLAALLWQWQRSAAAVAAARAELLQQVAAATDSGDPDAAELSRLMALLAQQPDHEVAADLLAAAARIELARQRPERAQALFGTVAANPAAGPAEQGLGAQILLRLHEAGGGAAADTVGMLRQAEAFALRAYAASGDPADLLRAWQAASRLADRVAVQQHAAALQQAAPESAAAQLAQTAAQFDPQLPLAQIDALRAAFPVAPPELEAMRVLLVLQSGDVRAAAREAEALLLRSPGVLAVRWAAALVFHACVLGQAEGSVERAQWRQRRDHQLDWLLERAPADDSRRPQWDQLRGER